MSRDDRSRQNSGTKPNSGSLFKNDKRRNNNDPQYTGNAVIECPDCGNRFEAWLNAWLNEARSGLKYFRIGFREKQASPPRREERDFDNGRGRNDSRDFDRDRDNSRGRNDNPPMEDFDDDIPF